MKWDWKAVLGLTVSGVLIWWVLRDVDVAEVWAEIRDARLGLLIAAVAVATSGMFVRALRWKVFLHPVAPRTALRNRFAAVNIGFATNNLLPARVGEFARAWSIARLESITVSGSVGSLVVERFMDAVAIFLLLLASVVHPSFPANATVGGRPIAAAITVVMVGMGALLVGLAAMIAAPRVFLRAVGAASRVLPEARREFVLEMAESFLEGMASLRDPGLLVRGFAWSLFTWSWNGVSFLLAFRAFGIDLGYAPALFVQAIIALGVAVPSAPGYFGTFHAAAVVGLSEVYRVSEEATLAFAFGFHLGGFFPVTLLGLWYAGRLGFSLSDLGHAEEVVEAQLHEEDLKGDLRTPSGEGGPANPVDEGP